MTKPFRDLSRPMHERLWLGPWATRPSSQRIVLTIDNPRIIGGTFRSWQLEIHRPRTRELEPFQFAHTHGRLLVNSAWVMGSVTDSQNATAKAKREAEQACLLFMVVRTRMARVGLPTVDSRPSDYMR